MIPDRVTLVEMGPRDGLQNIDAAIPTDAKIRFVDALTRAGLPVIEVGAFVSPKAVPQMADSARVFDGITRAPGTHYTALAPNLRGYDAARAAGADAVAVFTAASETFNQRNIRASIAESLERFAPVLERATADGVPVRGYVSCAFGCPYEGAIDPAAVVRVTADLFAMGVAEVSIGDTIGVATPNRVDSVLARLAADHPAERIALHFHDTRGTALANVLRALELGFQTFDTSAGGLGGCPFAPGATGNVATEDVLYLLDGLGVDTGVDFERVVDASLVIERALGTPLPSRALRATLAQRARDAAD